MGIGLVKAYGRESGKSCLQWQQLLWRPSGKDFVKKRWTVVVTSLRNLFIWANIFCIAFVSLGHGCNIVTYVMEPQLRRGQGSEWTISPILWGLCFVSICLHWYRYTTLAHTRVFVCVCVYARACVHTHLIEEKQTWYAVKKTFDICSDPFIPTKEDPWYPA